MLSGFREPESADGTLHKEPQESVLVPAMARLGVPVCIFGVLFLLCVWGITFLTSPDRFPVHTGDATVRLKDLESRIQLLTEQKVNLEHARQKLQTKEKAPVLLQAMSLSDTVVPVGDIFLSLEEARSRFSRAPDALITLPRIEYANGTLVLGGDVTDISGRSMQILADFVDSVRSIPGVISVSEPEYVSHPRASGGFVSPFTLTLTLRRV